MFQDADLLKTINNVYFMSYLMFLVFYSVLWFFKLSIRHKIFPPTEGVQATFWVSFGICAVITMFQYLANFLSDGHAPPFAFWVNFIYGSVAGAVLLCVLLFVVLSSIRDRLPER